MSAHPASAADTDRHAQHRRPATEAILLVGGKGTRLRPLTVHTPKPMIPAAGVPFLTHQLARARAAGVEHIVMATSYLAEVFEPHFGDGSALGLHLEYVTETEPLGTGGALRNVAHRLHSAPGDPVLVFNGDILTGLDIRALVATHRGSGADVSLHLTRVEDPRAFGLVPTDPGGRVTAFLEKPQTPEEIVTDQINAGAYVFTRSVLDTIPAGRPVSVERETFPGLLAAGRPPPGHGRLHVLARPRHPAGVRPRLRRPRPRPRPLAGRPGPPRRTPGAARRPGRRRRQALRRHLGRRGRGHRLRRAGRGQYGAGRRPHRGRRGGPRLAGGGGGPGRQPYGPARARSSATAPTSAPTTSCCAGPGCGAGRGSRAGRSASRPTSSGRPVAAARPGPVGAAGRARGPDGSLGGCPPNPPPASSRVRGSRPGRSTSG